MLYVYDSGVKLSLGKTRVKKKQVEMMIGQNIITRKCYTATVYVVLIVDETSVAFV